MEVFVYENEDKEAFLEKLVLFKTKLFLKWLDCLNVAEPLKNEILKETIKILEEDDSIVYL